MKTPGASWKASSASAVGSSWANSAGERLSAGIPARSAALIVGEVSASALAPGPNAVKKRAESCRKGRSTGRSRAAASRNGGPLRSFPG